MIRRSSICDHDSASTMKQEEQEKVQLLVRDTIEVLFRNILPFRELCTINIVAGVVLDRKQQFHFCINETIKRNEGYSPPSKRPKLPVQSPKLRKTPPSKCQIVPVEQPMKQPDEIIEIKDDEPNDNHDDRKITFTKTGLPEQRNSDAVSEETIVINIIPDCPKNSPPDAPNGDNLPINQDANDLHFQPKITMVQSVPRFGANQPLTDLSYDETLDKTDHLPPHITKETEMTLKTIKETRGSGKRKNSDGVADSPVQYQMEEATATTGDLVRVRENYSKQYKQGVSQNLCVKPVGLITPNSRSSSTEKTQKSPGQSKDAEKATESVQFSNNNNPQRNSAHESLLNQKNHTESDNKMTKVIMIEGTQASETTVIHVQKAVEIKEVTSGSPKTIPPCSACSKVEDECAQDLDLEESVETDTAAPVDSVTGTDRHQIVVEVLDASTEPVPNDYELIGSWDPMEIECMEEDSENQTQSDKCGDRCQVSQKLHSAQPKLLPMREIDVNSFNSTVSSRSQKQQEAKKLSKNDAKHIVFLKAELCRKILLFPGTRISVVDIQKLYSKLDRNFAKLIIESMHLLVRLGLGTLSVKTVDKKRRETSFVKIPPNELTFPMTNFTDICEAEYKEKYFHQKLSHKLSLQWNPMGFPRWTSLSKDQ